MSLGFSRQEYWSGLPFPSPGDLLGSGIKPTSSALAGRFFTTPPSGILPGCQKRVPKSRPEPGWEGSLGENVYVQLGCSAVHLKPSQHCQFDSLVAQLVKKKKVPEMRETQVQCLGWDNLLEKETATHSSILAWRIPWTEEPGGLQSMELQSQTRLSDEPFHFQYKIRLPRWQSSKESACQCRRCSLIPEPGRSPGEGNGNPLQYSCLENSWPEEPGGLQSMGSKSQTRLSTHTLI